MQQQRTINANQPQDNLATDDMATVAAFGFQRTVKAGKNVSETLEELGLTPQPYQSVRIGGQKVDDLKSRQVQAGEILTVTNQVRGGAGR
jgi:hypothetical protein